MRVVCLGSGPSLTKEDVFACRGEVVIAINNTVDLAPWAAFAFAADHQWWEARKGLPDFLGMRISIAPASSPRFPEIILYQQGPVTGLCTDGVHLATGKHSGYSAINFAAVMLRATEIVLLGYDMGAIEGRHHWHDPHPGDRHPAYKSWLPYYDSLKQPLTDLGVSVFNASRATAIPESLFPRISLSEVLNAESFDRHPSRAVAYPMRGSGHSFLP